jgi:hypothetical protein
MVNKMSLARLMPGALPSRRDRPDRDFLANSLGYSGIIGGFPPRPQAAQILTPRGYVSDE